MRKYKVVVQSSTTEDQYLCGFFNSVDEAYEAIPGYYDFWPHATRNDFHVKKIDPRYIFAPTETDYDHYIWSLIPRDECERVMNSDAAAEIDCNSLTCNSMRCYMLSQMIWKKGWTIIDIGCSYNAASYLFKDHERFIAVDKPYPDTDFHFEHFKADGTEYYGISGQDFIIEKMPKLDIDLKKTFVISHFVPDDGLSLLIRNTFPNCFVLYP